MLKKAGPASGAQKHWQHVTNDLRSGACKTPLIHRVPVPKPLVIYVGMPLPVLCCHRHSNTASQTNGAEMWVRIRP